MSFDFNSQIKCFVNTLELVIFTVLIILKEHENYMLNRIKY